MPCESRYTNIRQTQAERDAEIAAVVEAVTAALAAQRVELRIGQEGAAALNWLAGEALDMRGVTDGCVLLRLMNDNSMAFQEALAMAELQAGQKLNIAAIESGLHSHDGGRTWGRH